MDLGHKTKMLPICSGSSMSGERRGRIDTLKEKDVVLEAGSYRNLLLSC